MGSGVHDLRHKLLALREAFDRTFTEAPAVAARGSVGLITIRVGGTSMALRVSEVSGLSRRRKIVRVAETTPGLRGMAGFRGRLVVVYSLSSFLGQVPAHENEEWLVLCAQETSVGLCFGEFEAYREVEPETLRDLPAEERNEHLSGLFRCDRGSRPVVSIASVLETIRKAALGPGSTQGGRHEAVVDFR